MSLGCPFNKMREIFGKEGEGVHSYRIFNIAIVDVIATIIGAYLLSIFFKINFQKFLCNVIFSAKVILSAIIFQITFFEVWYFIKQAACIMEGGYPRARNCT